MHSHYSDKFKIWQSSIRRISSVLIVFLTLVVVQLTAETDTETQPPVVSNIHAEQRPETTLVDIAYDLNPVNGHKFAISVAVSDDGGETYAVSAKSFSGDVGENIRGGKSKKIVWDAGKDLPDTFGEHFRVKIIARPQATEAETPAGDETGKGEEGGIFISPVDGAKMRLIPAGEFEMGREGGTDTEPVHTIYLDAFYMDIYEVTNDLYMKFVEETGYGFPQFWTHPDFNRPNQPVVGVSWYDAAMYAQWAGKQLPTEAQWEKAARGGLVGKTYPWGDQISHDDANYQGVGGRDQWNGPAPVGRFSENGYGLFDIIGDVWEWCADAYNLTYYRMSPLKNPAGPEKRFLFVENDFMKASTLRVKRGASWASGIRKLHVAHREQFSPSHRSNNLGFRCVMHLPESQE